MDSDTEHRREENSDAPRHTLIGKCVMKTLTHPLDYARFLVQVSHNEILRVLWLCNY